MPDLHQPMNLPVVFEDEHYIAIHKPAGLLVHRSPIDKHETQFAVQILRDQIGQHVHPAHRLDKPTSGILLFAKTTEALSKVREQFVSHNIDKEYHALVRGFPPQQLTIDHPVKTRKDKLDKKPLEAPKDAITHLTTLATCTIGAKIERYDTSRYALVKLVPVTGRRHQLRYHMKHISHPIIGDSNYGKGVQNRYFQKHFGCHRLMLAATKLQFHHPYLGSAVTICTPPAADFQSTIEKLPFA
ncbi:MAG: pseudouridine synthase [Pseudomonadales bacterium]|nr:pseudouridine synthase [Pseudomonadales bacterium]